MSYKDFFDLADDLAIQIFELLIEKLRVCVCSNTLTSSLYSSTYPKNLTINKNFQ
jgi:hypothetical protein